MEPPLPAPVFLAEVEPTKARLPCLGVRVEVEFPGIATPTAAPPPTPTAQATTPESGRRKSGSANRKGSSRRPENHTGAIMTTHPGVDAPEALILHALCDRGVLDPAKLEVFREARTRGDDLPERILIRTGLATEGEIASAYSDALWPCP